jgi:hypothetical protein
MKIRITSGVATIVSGLLIALGPQFLFTVCEPMGENFMKCHWTARAEIGIGGLIAALGIALIVFASPKTRLGLAIAVVLAAVLALLFPYALIGGCDMPSMDCRKIAFPALAVISILTILGGALYIAYLARKGAASMDA